MLGRVAALVGISALAVSAAGCGSGILTDHEQIYVVSARGGKIRRLTSGSRASIDPAWSPDGKRLAFVSGSAVEIVTSSGRRLKKLSLPGPPVPDSPSWSPDGRRLAVPVGDEMTESVVVARADARSLRAVARTRGGTAGSGRGPVWSPDGRLLAYCLQGPETSEQGGVRASGELDLAVVRPDGTGRRTLTTAPGSESDPRWSPNGRLLLYDASPPNEPGNNGSSLRLVPASGGRSRLVVRLAYAWGASWSPDGKLIAFAGNAPGQLRTHLYVVRPDGTGLRQLTGEITPDRPVWSPDGKLIAFGTYRPGIDVIARDGSGRRTVASISGAEISGVTWSPDGKSIAFAARRQPPES